MDNRFEITFSDDSGEELFTHAESEVEAEWVKQQLEDDGYKNIKIQAIRV